ncbi:MAG TPA: LLM class flavin-dependent oxidoreductase [Blastocatellia bacterium]|nr:LLM class flavin-dependent oxidoreductase [Blastocatellia bacterium]
MKYGLVIQINDVQTICDLAVEAEENGWDAVFLADALAIETKGFPAFPWYDPWIAMTAVAMKTERILISTMIIAVPRRRPWKLAREAQTLDYLSNGRLIFCAGLGAAEHDGGFYKVGEPMDLKTRAERMGEALEIMTGLWTGKPFSFKGEHYTVDNMTMLPKPIQSPRIPVWVVGVWPREKSMRRALKYDGVIVQKYKAGPSGIPDANLIREVRDYVFENHPQSDKFDIVAGGTTPAKSKKRAIETVRPFAEAGATWWVESDWMGDEKKLRARIKQGPPLLEG